MPNWCNNVLKVTGDKKKLDEMLKLIKTGDFEFDFNKVVPMPEDLMAYDAPIKNKDKRNQHLVEFGATDWYTWRLANWGTKWSAGEGVQVDRVSKEECVLCFDTAWSPPGPIIEALGKKYTELTFRLSYTECGEGFVGVYTVEDGEVVEDICASSTFNNKEYRKLLGDEFPDDLDMLDELEKENEE